VPKRARQWIWLGLLVITTTGCFKQVVRTGRPAGQTVVDKPWVSTWLWGLVAAKEIDVRAQCPGGVAIVETETSFVNGLVGAVTFGIYTPQHARITCAGGGAPVPNDALEVMVGPAADTQARHAALARAVRTSIDENKTVVVRF
jgi:hypothetical protein